MAPRRTRLILAIAGVSLFATFLPGQTPAAPSPMISHLQMGLGKVARVGTWVPVSAQLHGPLAKPVSVSWLAADPVANECEYTDSRRYQVTEAGMKVSGLVRLGRAEPVEIQVLQDGRIMGRQRWTGTDDTRLVPSTCGVILIFGPDLDVERAIKSQASLRQRELAVARLTDLPSVPDDALAYDGVDLVVITASSRTLLQALNDPQWDALLRWVEGGGRLAVSLDPASAELPAIQQRLTRLLGTSVAGVDRQKDTTGLEDFAGVDQRLDVSERARGESWQGLPLVRLAPSRARVVASDGLGATRANWIYQTTAGLGLVTVAGFDLFDPVLVHWDGAPRLLGRIMELALRAPREVLTDSPNGELAHWGFEDLTGQLRMALDQIPEVSSVPFSLVAIAVGVYVALVSAGDFFLLRQIIGNFSWTWLTLPLLIVGASLVGYGWSVSWKGTVPRSSQLDLVDMDPLSGTVRWHSWCHLYSPQSARVKLDWRPLAVPASEDRVVHRLCSWEGLPGRGFGAMESRTASTLFRQHYRSEEQRETRAGPLAIRLLDVPMPAWSSHGFEGRGLARRPPEPVAPLQADSLSLLQGAIRSPVPFRLLQCALYFDRWYYELGTLEPGAEIRLTPSNQPLDLKARLTRKRIVDAKEVTSPWDPAGTDLARIAEMIMFHQAAGGTLFTGLKHEFRDQLDMSAHLLLNLAIVVGRPAEPVAGFTVDDGSWPLAGDRRAAFVRFTIPVQPSGGTRP